MPVPLVFAALDYSTTLKTTFYGLLVVGFVVAVVVGSIAWYNSKKTCRLGRCGKTRLGS